MDDEIEENDLQYISDNEDLFDQHDSFMQIQPIAFQQSNNDAMTKKYACHSSSHIYKLMMDKTREVIEVTKMKETFSRILLTKYNWDKNRFLEDYFDKGEEQMYLDAHLIAPPSSSSSACSADVSKAPPNSPLSSVDVASSLPNASASKSAANPAGSVLHSNSSPAAANLPAPSSSSSNCNSVSSTSSTSSKSNKGKTRRFHFTRNSSSNQITQQQQQQQQNSSNGSVSTRRNSSSYATASNAASNTHTAAGGGKDDKSGARMIQFDEDVCGICTSSESDGNNFIRIGCVHRYCRDCWTAYIAVNVKDNKGARMTCPTPNCDILVDDETVLQLVEGDAPLKHAFICAITNAFVTVNPNIAWCPGEQCDQAIEISSSCPAISLSAANASISAIASATAAPPPHSAAAVASNSNCSAASASSSSPNATQRHSNTPATSSTSFCSTSFSSSSCSTSAPPTLSAAANAAAIAAADSLRVQCERCGHVCCFKCLQEWHEPVLCADVRAWTKKLAADSKNTEWVSKHTKECPRCFAVIEKNGGCNHMQCNQTHCRHEFCWKCMGDWASHGTNYFNCNRYEEKAGQDARNQMAQNRKELERYVFYVEGYNAHRESAKFEAKIQNSVKLLMTEMQKLGMTWIEVQFLDFAFRVLVECRRVLKYSFVFAFYVRENNQLSIFEKNQQDLSMATEALSKFFERELKEMDLNGLKQVVQDKARYCEKRCAALVAHVFEGYEKGYWEARVTPARADLSSGANSYVRFISSNNTTASGATSAGTDSL